LIANRPGPEETKPPRIAEDQLERSSELGRENVERVSNLANPRRRRFEGPKVVSA
jgi:hypothetical protein